MQKERVDDAAPRLSGILETVLYFTEEERTEAFYSEVLGMRLLDRQPGRSLFYRAGPSVLLLFRAEQARSGGSLPPHGADGSIHTCFLVPPEEYARWKKYLTRRGVSIVQEVDWTNGESFFFEDPDGNLLEMANADIWPA